MPIRSPVHAAIRSPIRSPLVHRWGATVTATSQNLLTGSNTFNGTSVWSIFSGTGSTTATGTTNPETGETYTQLDTTASQVLWRYDTSNILDTQWTPTGNTTYTLSVYAKKNASTFNFQFFIRTLGGTDQSSTMSVNTNTWAISAPTGTLTIATYDKVFVATDEYRLYATFTTSSGTNRILWEMRNSISGTDSILVSSAKATTAGLDAYSPGY